MPGSAAVRRIALPPEAPTRSTLPRVDYADAFLVPAVGPPGRTAEEWARATLEGASATMRRQLRWGWTALGLKLGPDGSERHVLGWEVRRSDPDLVLLGLGSRIGMPAELLFERRGDGLLFATLVQHRTLLARATWLGIGPRHRRIVPALLARAAQG
jgi:hypothetical protein